MKDNSLLYSFIRSVIQPSEIWTWKGVVLTEHPTILPFYSLLEKTVGQRNFGIDLYSTGLVDFYKLVSDWLKTMGM